MIFTSPSSARGNLDAEPVPEPQGRRKKTPSKRPPVAAQLRMDGQVTVRAIAYAAVQVHRLFYHSSWLTISSQLHFALCDATHWMSHYNGFNYEEFYEFIIDFFEADQTPEGRTASKELYDWWNRYVAGSMSTFCATDSSPEKFSQSLLLLEPLRLSLRGSHHSQFYETNAEPAYSASPLSLF